MMRLPPKKYIVFVFPDEAKGGLNDAAASFDDIDEARSYAASKLDRETNNAQIVKRDSWRVIWELWLDKRGLVHEERVKNGNS